MLRFAHFWQDVVWPALALSVRFYARADLAAGALGLVGAPSLAVLLQFASWQVLLVGVLAFLSYAIALAVYKKFTEVEDRKEELEERLAERQKRKVIKDLLGRAMKEGRNLDVQGKGAYAANLPAARQWVERTHDLIEDALDTGEAQCFRGDEIDKDFYPVGGCLSRLNQLIGRANSLETNPDFNPQDWIRR